MDLRLALMCGTDLPIPSCQLVAHQPKIKEISLIGEEDFFSGAQYLCLNKTMFIEDKRDLETTNNFQIFMTIMSQKETADKKSAVQQVLTLLFPNYKTMITPQSLIFIPIEKGDTTTIDGNNFDDFQEVLRLVFCSKSGPMDQQTFNPADKKAKEIADKIMRGRKKVAEQKGETNVSIFSQYLSILTVGLSIPLQNLMDLTMFQLYDLVERYSLYTNWDLDIKSRLAGAKPDSGPDNWMKNIHK